MCQKATQRLSLLWTLGGSTWGWSKTSPDCVRSHTRERYGVYCTSLATLAIGNEHPATEKMLSHHAPDPINPIGSPNRRSEHPIARRYGMLATIQADRWNNLEDEDARKKLFLTNVVGVWHTVIGGVRRHLRWKVNSCLLDTRSLQHTGQRYRRRENKSWIVGWPTYNNQGRRHPQNNHLSGKLPPTSYPLTPPPTVHDVDQRNQRGHLAQARPLRLHPKI